MPRLTRRSWGGRDHTVTAHDQITVNPNDGITNNDKLKKEAALLPNVAALAQSGEIQCLMSLEAEIEMFGLRDLDSETGHFYGAPYEVLEAPIPYSRVIAGFGVGNYREEEAKFLLTLKHPRFLRLQRLTGAYQGKKKTNRNQLLDAYHLWCAEYHKCSYLLTLDFKLAKVIKRAKEQLSVKLVCPSELLNAVS